MNQQGNRVKLAIWDTAGQERFRTLTPSYYRGAQGAILVYDVSSRESFTKVEDWLTELETYSTNHDLIKMLVSQNVTWPVFFYTSFHIQVGNKCDKEGERMVSREEGQKCARKYQMMFIEVCASLDLTTKNTMTHFRRAPRPRRGCSVPSRSLWRRSSRPRGFGSRRTSGAPSM